MAIILVISTILLSGVVGVVEAKSVQWWSDAFYTARTIDGFPLTGYVKGDTISLDLENEIDFQTIYTERVAMIKNLDNGKIVKKYTVIPRVTIPFGGMYSTKWVTDKAGRYQACAEVINNKNNKKVRCTQTIIVYNKPTPALAISTDKSFKLGQQVWFGLSNPGTLSVYLDPHYTVFDIDHGKSYIFSASLFREELDVNTGLGFGWDQKNNNGQQVQKGRYKIRWYYGESPSPAPKNKYSESMIFRIK